MQIGLIASAAASIVVSGAAALLLIGDPPARAIRGGEGVRVSFDEWTLRTDRARVPAGPVSFFVENRGGVDHELLVVKTRLAPAELPQGIAGPLLQLAGKLVLGKPHTHEPSTARDGSAVDHIGPGDRAIYDVNLGPGDYVLICNLPGHYRRGQYTGLEIG